VDGVGDRRDDFRGVLVQRGAPSGQVSERDRGGVVAAGREPVEVFPERGHLPRLLRGAHLARPTGQRGLVEQFGDDSPRGSRDAHGQVGPPGRAQVVLQRLGELGHAARRPAGRVVPVSGPHRGSGRHGEQGQVGGVHPERAGDHPSGEPFGLIPVGRLELINLVQHDEGAGGQGADPGQQVLFRGADRRVGGEYEQCDIHCGHGGLGHRRIVVVHRTDPGCVDEVNRWMRQSGFDMDYHIVHALFVAGIAGLGHVPGEIGHRCGARAAVVVVDLDAFRGTCPHRRGDRGERDDSGGQDVSTQDRVADGRLAAFGLPDEQHPQAGPRPSVAQVGDHDCS